MPSQAAILSAPSSRSPLAELLSFAWVKGSAPKIYGAKQGDASGLRRQLFFSIFTQALHSVTNVPRWNQGVDVATITKRVWTTSKGEAREAWLLAFTDATGRRHKEQHAKKRDAEASRVRHEGRVADGSFRGDAKKATVDAACQAYIDAIEARRDRGEVTEHYVRTTKAQLWNYVSPKPGRALGFDGGIGAVKLSQLTKGTVAEFRDRLRKAGVSAVTTRRILGSLSRALAHAVESDQVATNVAAGVRTKGRRDEGTEKVTPPSKAALAVVLAEAGDLADTIRFAAASGLRASETHALQWKNVDLEAGTVLVDRRVDAYGNVDVAKSKAGMRIVPLGGAMLRRLKAWKERTKFNSPDDFVFPATNGGHVDHRNLASRHWRPLIAKIAKAKKGFEPFGWHALRHFAISTWIEQGLPPKTVQTYAGHSTLAVTMDRYGHLFPSADNRAAMDRIADELFSS